MYEFDGFGDMGQFDMNTPGCIGPEGFNEASNFGLPMNYRGPRDNYLFTMDEKLLLSIGFTPVELGILKDAVGLYGLVSTQKLSSPPFMITDSRIISRILYAYNICMGKTTIDPDDPISISKHKKKMTRLSGSHQNFSCFYIKHRNFEYIPRTAVVAGLPKGSFYVLNSKLYDMYEGSYRVDKIAQEWVTIYSTKKMAVTYKDRLNMSLENREWGIEGILKVEEVGSQKEGKPWLIKIHKSHCRLCNRFMIIITTRKVAEGATEHHGGYKVVLADGTIVYVYARTTDVDSYGNPKESIPKTNNDTTVFDYGFYPNEIETKLSQAMSALASTYAVVYSKRLSGDTPFKMISEYSGMETIRKEPDTFGEDSYID